MGCNLVDSGENTKTIKYISESVNSSVLNINSNSSFNQWTSPIATEYQEKGVNYLLFGGVNNDGNQIITRINQETYTAEQKVVYSGYSADDHNAPAVFITDSNNIIVGLTGHRDDSKIHIQIFKNWSDVKKVNRSIEMEEKTTYVQIQQCNDRIFVFTRSSDFNLKWKFIYSDDGGNNWSKPIVIYSTDVQYYMLFKSIPSTESENNTLSTCIRFIGTDHPTSFNKDQVRVGSIVYNRNGNTKYEIKYSQGYIDIENISSGDTGLSDIDFFLFYSPLSGNKFRIWDMVSNGLTTLVLVSEFKDDEKNEFKDAKYKILVNNDDLANNQFQEISLSGLSEIGVGQPSYFGGGAFGSVIFESQSSVKKVTLLYVNNSDNNNFEIVSSVFNFNSMKENYHSILKSKNSIFRLPVTVKSSQNTQWIINSFSTYVDFNSYYGATYLVNNN
ncbi:MAG: hypothetical protein ABJ387_15010 [Balneola sp.]